MQPLQENITATAGERIDLAASATDADCDLATWMLFRNGDMVLEGGFDPVVCSDTGGGNVHVFGGTVRWDMRFEDTGGRYCTVGWNVIGATQTATPTPTLTGTPTHTQTKTPTKTPTVTPTNSPAAPVCSRLQPLERNVTASGDTLQLIGHADDADCDLHSFGFYQDGTWRYGDSFDSGPVCASTFYYVGGTGSWGTTVVWELRVSDSGGRNCAVDWIITRATTTPTRAPTATQTPTPTPTATRTLTPTPTPNLRITALQYLGTDEYVQITNNGPGNQVMTGWTIVSVVGMKQTYGFPSGYTLNAGSWVRVHSGPSASDNPPAHLKWTSLYIWDDTSDAARLYNASNNLVDTWAYP